MLTIKNLRVSTENKDIINNLSLTVRPGEVAVIMGPNGSGKSTLAYSLMGHPNYVMGGGSSIKLDGKELVEKSADERAMRGLFLASQQPVSIPGLTTWRFLWQVYKKRGGKLSVVEFKKWVWQIAEDLDLKTELLERSLNDGFSGGEKKKVEIMQMIVSSPKYVILDEIDSGLDVDAVKKIALRVNREVVEKKLGVIVITHYQRILKWLEVGTVHILEAGKIVRSGGKEVVLEIEEKGYKK